MIRLTSEATRNHPLFLRNQYAVRGQWGIPLVKKQEIDTSDLELIACSATRLHDTERNKRCGVHFFVDDYRFTCIYRNPEKSLSKFSQYAFLLTPDYSTYADMNPWRQLESIAHSRWCGAFWQSKGLTVIPTISWSTPSSYAYCFDGVETGAIVAVGMVGCKRNKTGFMRGYQAMMEKIRPEAVICYGTPFPEMEGHVIPVDYRALRKVVC